MDSSSYSSELLASVINKEFSIFELKHIHGLDLVWKLQWTEFSFTNISHFISSITGTQCILIFIKYSIYLNNNVKERRLKENMIVTTQVTRHPFTSSFIFHDFVKLLVKLWNNKWWNIETRKNHAYRPWFTFDGKIGNLAGEKGRYFVAKALTREMETNQYVDWFFKDFLNRKQQKLTTELKFSIILAQENTRTFFHFSLFLGGVNLN